MKRLTTTGLMAMALLGAWQAGSAAIVWNPAFDQGTDGKAGWGTWLNVFNSTNTLYKYGTSWDTGYAVVQGGGAVSLDMHQGWSDNGNGPADLGDWIENNFYFNFAYPSQTADLVNQTLTLTGNFSVTEAFDPGTYGIAFVKVLGGGWQQWGAATAAIDAGSGTFICQLYIEDNAAMNAVQVGFAMRGKAPNAAGQVTVWNLNLTTSTPLAPAPVAVNVQPSGAADMQVSFESVSGLDYQLEYSTNAMATWTPYGAQFAGTGGTLTLTHRGGKPAAGNQVFYRVNVIN